VLPIVFGYLLVHNLQYLVVNCQLLLPLAGNPVGEQWWPIHLPYPFNDDYEPRVVVLPTSFYWHFSVLVIVAVHVLAVVLAHRRLAAGAAGAGAARAGEYRWLVAMVGYTMASLWLVAQPLVQEAPPARQDPAAAPVTTPYSARCWASSSSRRSTAQYACTETTGDELLDRVRANQRRDPPSVRLRRPA
jgi:hypothetical protein